jgi:hypothetical protein
MSIAPLTTEDHPLGAIFVDDRVYHTLYIYMYFIFFAKATHHGVEGCCKGCDEMDIDGQ